MNGQTPNGKTVYRLSDDVVFRKTNRSLIMAFNKHKGVMFELNDTASSVLDLIDGDRTVDGILSSLAEEYEEADGMLDDVCEIIGRFEEAALVERVGETSDLRDAQ